MAKHSPKSLTVTKQDGQISASGGEMSNYLIRQMPIWNNPHWLSADVWRAFVHKQPIAVLCRDAISSYILSLDWAIVARESDQQDEFKEDIKYYTRMLERGNAYYTDIEFSNHVEFLVKDLFDLPFGTASEIGREYDMPDGKVVWVRPLDAGTLAPTLNADFPVVQHFPNYNPVVFPRDSISRIFLSPRTEIQREGWGFAPPERIYLAMEMLNRGDVYYSQLLLNTPEAGILDLMDMDKESATAWVGSFRDLLYGINPLKIPVLYEHQEPAKWIPFGKLPNEILYEGISARYITIVTAGYGLSPSDIGFASSSNGGETLAGTIRQERRSAKSGKSLAKTKLKAYFEKILPDHLEFKWVDFDDEKNVSMSRARMATANAFSVLIQNQILTPDESRRQIIADGLVSITIPETIDRTSVEWPQNNVLRYVGKDNGKKEENSVGNPKSPSGGGQGEVIPQQIVTKHRAKIEVSLAKSAYAGNRILGALIEAVKEKNDLTAWEASFDSSVVGKAKADLMTEAAIDDAYNAILLSLDSSEWVDAVSKDLCIALSTEEGRIRKSRGHEFVMSKAEQEYIAGERDSIALTDEEELFLSKDVGNPVDFLQVKKSLLESIIPKIILVAKSSILGHKYPIDTNDLTDNNNLRIARSIAEKVYQMFPSILDETRQLIKIGE